MYSHERSLVKRMTGKQFALLGINSDKDKDELIEAMKKEGVTWRSFWNGPEGTQGPIAQSWNIEAWPTLYVLDIEGRIRFKSVGSPGEKVIDGWIDTLLDEASETAPTKR